MHEPPSFIQLTQALLEGSFDEASLRMSQPDWDAKAFLYYLRSQHLAGSVGIAVEGASFKKPLNPFLAQSLMEAAEHQQHYNAATLSQTLDINSDLTRSGGRVLHLKGCYHAMRYWGGVDRRFLWDIDVLVPAAAFDQALQQLQSSGYSLSSKGPMHNRLTKKFTHAVTLSKGGPEVDVHKVLRVRPGYRIDYAKLWSSTQRYELGDTTIEVMSTEYTLLFALLGAAHDLEAGKLRLKMLFELRYILEAAEQQLDWGAFFSGCQDQGVASISREVITLVLRVLAMHDKVPRLSKALAMAAPYHIDSTEKALRLLNNPRNSFENRHWFASVSPAGRLRYALWWLASSPARFAVNRRQ